MTVIESDRTLGAGKFLRHPASSMFPRTQPRRADPHKPGILTI